MQNECFVLESDLFDIKNFSNMSEFTKRYARLSFIHKCLQYTRKSYPVTSLTLRTKRNISHCVTDWFLRQGAHLLLRIYVGKWLKSGIDTIYSSVLGQVIPNWHQNFDSSFDVTMYLPLILVC